MLIIFLQIIQYQKFPLNNAVFLHFDFQSGESVHYPDSLPRSTAFLSAGDSCRIGLHLAVQTRHCFQAVVCNIELHEELADDRLRQKFYLLQLPEKV